MIHLSLGRGWEREAKMQLILWRHAEAEDGTGKPDIERDLTKRGRKQAEIGRASCRERV